MNYTKPLLSASTISGDDVKNAQGEDLGKIKDLMLNTESGDIEYAVLAFGGFLNLGDKFFAIPWEALTLDTEEECFILNVDKEKLEDAPGFDKDHWPNMADPQFREKIYSHYGLESRRTALGGGI